MSWDATRDDWETKPPPPVWVSLALIVGFIAAPILAAWLL